MTVNLSVCLTAGLCKCYWLDHQEKKNKNLSWPNLDLNYESGLDHHQNTKIPDFSIYLLHALAEVSDH